MIFTPGTQCVWGFLQGNNQAHELFYWQLSSLKQADYCIEIFDFSISRPEDIQLFLHKLLRLVAHRLLGVPDINDSARIRDFFHGRSERLWSANCFDDDVGTTAISYLRQTFAQRFPRTVDGDDAKSDPREIKLLIIHIDRNCPSTPGTRSCYGSEPNSSTAEDGDRVACGDSSPRRRMETYGQRLNQT